MIGHISILNQMVYYSNDHLNRVFAAVADPTRRALLAELEGRDNVTTARRSRENLDEFAQHRIATEVSDRIVDRLEVVDVDRKQRDFSAATRSCGNDLTHHLIEPTPIQAPRERIGMDHRRQLGTEMIVRSAEHRNAVGLTILLINEFS